MTTGSRMLLPVPVLGVVLLTGAACTGGDDTATTKVPSGMSGTTVTSEVDYLVELAQHHEEAIGAASELARSTRPQVRALGRDIVASQTARVSQVRAWLTRWYPGAPTSTCTPVMRELSGVSGDRLDRWFLSDMVVHQMSAVMMSMQVVRGGLVRHHVVEVLADEIVQAQRAEIVRMMRWQRAWFGRGAPSGMMHGLGKATGSRARDGGRR